MATPRYYDKDGNEIIPRPSPAANLLGWAVNLAALAGFVLAVYLLWPFVAERLHGQSAPPSAAPTAPLLGNVGGQAPPSVRGTYPDAPPPPAARTPVPVAAPVAVPALPVQNIGGSYNDAAAADAAYATAAARTAQETAPAPDLGPLPQNSAGQPVIDAVQQQQLNQAAELAAKDAQAAVDNARATDVASRPPDVSYEEAKALLHRDPCSVPRADPHTCAQGLYKPTPIGAP